MKAFALLGVGALLFLGIRAVRRARRGRTKKAILELEGVGWDGDLDLLRRSRVAERPARIGRIHALRTLWKRQVGEPAMSPIRAILVLTTLFIVAGHQPGAWACSCAATSDAQYFRNADVVFIGTATDSEDPNAGEQVTSSGDPIEWTLDVRSVQKGDPHDPARVTSARDGISCGFEFEIGERYQVFSRTDDGDLRTGLCDGTRALATGAAYIPPAPDPSLPRTGVGSDAADGSALPTGIALLAAALRFTRRRRTEGHP